ncbi:30S ribosomal protein S12 methylthiotransferase RimO [Knoellia subterranea]|uniref:Ribosomal protein uS12 methylthiotransferase RimO n=1 Tax=Knoellia subterranea KCTC 19937 TaxID=1385521 RepID=A0A0A0JSR5_9MICO|nr:30S ribosomal protein S12 methylthiotransferase RimO [Knoellia subterranea]KGN39107.1 ribosomal protein S12 methylthiotransferase [Knoellia subterranea KCTC 19937]
MPAPDTTTRSVAVVTLGCTRNDVDSEELAGRLAAGGWTLVEDAAEADVAVVNTCGFVEQAKKDSIDSLIEASSLKETGRTQKVVAVGCLAERYGQTLADELPEADAVLGFDSYADMSTHLRTILDGGSVKSHVPSDRRKLLPLSPVTRQEASAEVALPGHAAPRARLDSGPWAPLKIASGCDRRCAFCAIPMFRGSFVSRRPTDVLEEARWLAGEGVRELFLVSENSTSYGKDLGDLALMDALLPELADIDGIERVRVSYLQPAEVRPGLLDTMVAIPEVMPWFDLSFQHASSPLLRRMRRFGGTDSFLGLIEDVRRRSPLAGIRSNVIVGFPGETEAEVDELAEFLTAARLDVVGVFGYSDEDGTEGELLPDKVAPEAIAERVARITDLVEELTAQRAEDRIGETVRVLVEGRDEDTGEIVGRAEHQGPDVDGITRVVDVDAQVGETVMATVIATEGIDLVADLA